MFFMPDIEIFNNYVPTTFSDLSRPVAIQSKEKEDKYIQNYRMLQESEAEPYHYASLYSNSGTVLHYLVRLPPFTKMFLDYQGNNPIGFIRSLMILFTLFS
jgi:hypothetical protein